MPISVASRNQSSARHYTCNFASSKKNEIKNRMANILWYAFIFGMINPNFISGASVFISPPEEEEDSPVLEIEFVDLLPMFQNVPRMGGSFMMKNPLSDMDDYYDDDEDDEMDEMKEDMEAMSFVLYMMQESMNSKNKDEVAEELDRISKYLHDMVKSLRKEDKQPSARKNTKNPSGLTTPSAVEVTIEMPIVELEPIIKPLPLQFNKKDAESNDIDEKYSKKVDNDKKKGSNNYDSIFFQKWVKGSPASVQELDEKNNKESKGYKPLWLPK